MLISRLSVLTVAATLGAALAFAAGVSQAEDPGVLLRAAIEQEEVNGDLEAAIALYKKIVAAGGADREVAAKALLRLGGCYEKLGREEAGKVYRQLIADFADQQPQVRLAQERLAALTQRPAVGARTDMVARRIWSGDRADVSGTVSPDGRHLSYTDWWTGDLAVRDLDAGESRHLTDKGPWTKSSECAASSIWSPDGRRIAYAWFANDGTAEIRVINLDGTAMRVLHAPRQPYRSVEPLAWSRDSRWILARTSSTLRDYDIGLIPADGGAVQILRKTLSRNVLAALSPDARSVAYEVRQGANAAERDIYVVPTAGGQAAALVRHAADDFAPVWSPEGKWLLFVSDRAGSYDLWGLPVAGGSARGEPQRVKGDIGGAIPLGITDGGSLLYGLWTGMRDVYTAAVDFETGRVLTRPERISKRLVGVSQEPHWSPDGMQLAYVVEQSRVPGQHDRLLCINSTETGDSNCRALEGLPGIFFPQWSPKGRTISIYDSGATGTKRRVCLVDPATGTVTALRDLEGISLSGVYERQGVWAPDGRGIVLWRCDVSAGVQQLLRWDIETKQETVLYKTTFPPSIAQNPDELAFSPDHRWLVFRSNQGAAGNLSVMPADGGEPRVLVRLDRGQGIQSVAWTPDGKSVLFSRRLGENGSSGIFRVALEGGEPIRCDVEMDSISSLGVHPDGKRIVFQSGTSSVEIWVLENFLPTLEERPQVPAVSGTR